ncbi:glycosyltransferase family 2 protein [Phocaeicola coprocola]|uniref:glycosyltransferase family 2 protein n=1 Tax=Phocaeicola coprocola TaxID=310298 RepID=UPI0026707655|nr:glycosyltransferase family 2 protein [Phocaeicola coprocola]
MIEEQPLISCIIPVFNAEKYLHRCINSILAQDYPTIEIILIDDGSTDTSSTICDEYAKQYCNIIVKHTSNKGASLARKTGLELAKGEYLTFVDADDYVTHNYVSAMFEALKKYNTEISSCCQQIIKPNDILQVSTHIEILLLKDSDLMSRFFWYEFWGMPASLYHKAVFKRINFPKATLSEDYYIKCQIFLRNCKMAYVDAPLYIYEKHADSLSNTKLSAKAFEEFENTIAVYEIIRNQNPQYTQLALKNAIETCVKLLLMGDSVQHKKYKRNYTLINKFMKIHSMEIFRNRYLLRNVKILALVLRYFPYLYRFIKK